MAGSDLGHPARPPLRVVCGPTAAGKSALALALAERYGAAIVSADSRQIYRRFDVGTAKPSLQERRRVPHFGIDIVEPTARYSAFQWADDAERWVDEIERSGRVPLIVGGTGFYLRALFEPLFEAPEVDGTRRAALEPVLGAMSLTDLRRWCAALDPSRAHLGRTQLLRAIETALLSGERLSDLHARRARAPRRTPRYLVVDPGAPLADRIAARVDSMLVGGWISEVCALVHDVPADAPAWKSSGYGAVRRHVLGQLDRDSAAHAITIETRQYAKRQRTWFRHQLAGASVTRVNPDDVRSGDIVNAWWHGEGGV